MRWSLISSLMSVAVVIGCRQSTAPDERNIAGPVQTPTMVTVSPGQIIAARGEVISQFPTLPAVRLFTSPDNKPIVGAAVTFTLFDPAGGRQTAQTITDSLGIARLSVWKIGDALGKYTVTAGSAGIGLVSFTAFVRGAIVAIYDLVEIHDPSFPDGSVEGHYVLYEDRSWDHFYHHSVESYSPTDVAGTYTATDSSIVFQVEPLSTNDFYRKYNYRFATGTISGTKLDVSYVDFIDYSPETYVRR